jgi:hypothetical protein
LHRSTVRICEWVVGLGGVSSTIALKQVTVSACVLSRTKRSWRRSLECDVVGRNQDGVLLQNLTPEEVTRRFVSRVTKEEASELIASAIDDCCADVRLTLTQVNK